MVQYCFLQPGFNQLFFPAVVSVPVVAKERISIERIIYFSAMQFRTFCKNIVIAGTLAIWLIKFFIRPYFHPAGFTGFFLGIAPNLLGSFLLPFGAYWIHSYRRFFNRLLRYTFFSNTRIVCLFGFTLLVVNEYLQLIPFFRRTFDYYDIVSSAIGLSASYCCFSAIQRRQALSG